jgi:hypothetical protein
MGKVITAKKKEGDAEQAKMYIRTYILFPSGVMGLITMVIGTVMLVYQLIFDTYDEWTFAQSTMLIVVGIIFGWGQTRYHRLVLREYPEFFASRMKSTAARGAARGKKMPAEVKIDHPIRKFMPLYYVLCYGTLLGLAGWCFSTGSLDYMPAFFLPWAGFFWGKLFTWHKVIPPTESSGKK